MKLKTYMADINTHVNRHVFDMLEQPGHIRQARVLIVAESKTAAAAYPDSLPGGFVRHVRVSELRLAGGNDVDAMAAAGHLTDPAVYVMPCSGYASNGVVQVNEDGAHLIGRIVIEDGRWEFEPAGTITIKVRPEDRERLARHLNMQSTATLEECRQHADGLIAALNGKEG